MSVCSALFPFIVSYVFTHAYMKKSMTFWYVYKVILEKFSFKCLCRTRRNFSNQMSRSTRKSNILISLRCCFCYIWLLCGMSRFKLHVVGEIMTNLCKNCKFTSGHILIYFCFLQGKH